MEQAEKNADQKKINPLIWVAIIVLGLILYIFVGSDRGHNNPEKLSLKPAAESGVIGGKTTAADATVNRELLVPPGMRAREMIKQMRDQGKPYALDQVMASASAYANEGNLADAYLAFYFAAREGHVEAMMMMAEMSDPTLFQSENNLLDRADPIQAYKWYKMALDKEFEPARPRLQNLHQWAKAEAGFGNQEAAQLLLNF